MRDKLVFIFRILFLAAIILLVVFFRPVKTETNLLKAVFGQEENVLVDLSNKFSSRINVLVESDDAELAEKTADEFIKSVKNFKVISTNPAQILKKYDKYQNNLLSSNTYNLLKQKEYSKVAGNSLQMLYNPVMTPLASLENDPFLLLTDFIMSLSNGGQVNGSVFYNGKFYNIVMLEVDTDLALSPNLLNDEVKKLIDLQEEFSNSDVKLYMTGTPVHSYYASSRAMAEINIMCIISTLFVIGLIYFYFKSLKPVIPVAISIGLGILAGFFVTTEVFKSIHILTFVFSTTLIGICVDYSLHYFAGGKKIFKSLTVSLLTTVSAFFILLFSEFVLLKQIAVFTITGLVCVYLIVTLFYPLFIKEPYKIRALSFDVAEKLKKYIVVFVVLVSIFGLLRVKFDDNIKNMYVPSKALLQAEKLFAEVVKANNKTSFLIVKGKNIEEILENEEKITSDLEKKGIEYQALSKFIPSEKRQNENRILRHRLYESELNSYAQFLNDSQKKALLNTDFKDGYLHLDSDFEFLKSFLLDKNTSVIIVSDDVEGALNLQRDISAQISKCRVLCVKLLLPIFVILLLILSWIYNLKGAVKIIMPSFLATGFVFGVLGILNQPVNLFNIMAIFLIIGFGLDYSVFRYGGEKESREAVLISCLTTVVSFALLACVSFKLISSLGLVLSVGLIVSYILSLVCIKKG